MNKFYKIILLFCFFMGGCAVAPTASTSKNIAFDAQTGLQDGGLIGSPFVVNGVVWWKTSDDFRADYVRLLALYGSQLPTPPSSADEGWNLTVPISCNPGVRENMKLLRTFARSPQLNSPK